ncbi:MAG: hypothetical protein ABIH76_00240 [Candidatus Bathyarchaeota archaeon]
MSEKATEWEIERGLGTEGRLRIMRTLIKKPDEVFTKYQLERLVYLKPIAVRKNLNVLTEIGWVQELPYQPRKYKVNMDKETVRHLANFFEKTGYI